MKKVETKITQKSAREISKERLRRISKSRRHHWRTTGRVLKYGGKSFARNTWLSVAAIAIMAITLIILSATLIATDVMRTMIGQIEAQVDISVYIKQSATEKQVDQIIGRMTQLPYVTKVESITPQEANHSTIQKLIEDNNITDASTIKELNEAPNALPWTLNIKLTKLDSTNELKDFVDHDESMKDMLDARPPTYANKNREAIERIAHIMNRIQIIGLIAAAVFALVAILVVFNTIRMAIFSRKEEIYMMKLVGASRSFIAGPFLVEAALYGIVSAIIAGSVVAGVMYALNLHFATMISPTFQLMQQYWYFCATAFICGGIILGVISSLLATRKYLKIQ